MPINMQQGYIKLYRQIQDNELWLTEPFTRAQAWIDLIMLANHKRKMFFKRGVEVVVERGQVGYSELALSHRWQWSRGKVNKFLKYLEREQQIEQQKTFVTTLITVLNYEKYQQVEQQTGQQNDNRMTAERQQNDNRMTLTSNDNNEKNDKKYVGADKPPRQTQKFIPPNIDEVRAYIQEKKYTVDAEKFHDFYTSKNWYVGKNKMKDWRAAVRTWTKNRDGTQGTTQQAIKFDKHKVNKTWEKELQQQNKQNQEPLEQW